MSGRDITLKNNLKKHPFHFIQLFYLFRELFVAQPW